MTMTSLQDQLLKAGLINKKQAKQATKHNKQQARKARKGEVTDANILNRVKTRTGTKSTAQPQIECR